MSMSGYCKLFSSIVGSTIWREPYPTRVLWITMLALADRDGVVEVSTPGLADLARMPIKDARKALATLESPDPDSRSKAHDGRRILKTEDGWKILNYEKYREKCDQADLLEKNRLRQQRFRERHNLAVTSVTPRNATSRSVTPPYGDGDGDACRKDRGVGKENQAMAEQIYAAYPKKVARPAAIHAITKALKGISADTLLDRTKQFAALWSAVPRSEMGFCPHPSTWFNGERFNDDPSTWKGPTTAIKPKTLMDKECERNGKEVDALCQSLDEYQNKLRAYDANQTRL